MRSQWTIWALLAASSGGCSGSTVAQPPPPPVDWSSLNAAMVHDAGAGLATDRERALPAEYAAAFAAPSFESLRTIFDDDVHFSSPGLDDTDGRMPAISDHERLFGAFADRRMVIQRIWRTATEQSLEWTVTGTQAHDWMGVPATHRPVLIHGATLLWTKDDGLVTEAHVYLDTALVKAQLGAGPKELLRYLSQTLAQDAGAAPLSAPAADAGAASAGPPIPLFAWAMVGVDAGGATPEVFEQTGSSEEKRNVTVARGSLDALENNDLAAYVRAFDEGVEVFTLERPQPLRGLADVTSYFKSMRRSVGQLDTTVTSSWGVGAFVVLEYTIAGEQLGPIAWVPAQRDKVIRMHIVDVVRLEGGKITRLWRFDDPVEILHAAPI